MLVILLAKDGHRVTANTSLLNEIGACPNNYGLPMLHSVIESNGYFFPAFKFSFIFPAVIGTSPLTAYSAFNTFLLMLLRLPTFWYVLIL